MYRRSACCQKFIIFCIVFYLKGTVQQDLTWIISNINRYIFLKECSAEIVLNYIQLPFCVPTVQHYIVQKRWRFLLQLASSKNHFQKRVNSRNYTSKSYWHTARVFIRLDTQHFLYIVTEINQLTSEFPAACQLK